MNSRNLIIALAAVLGVCVFGICIAGAGFVLFTAESSSQLATIQPGLTAIAVQPADLTPRVEASPPVILPRGSATTSISRGTPSAGTSKVVFTDDFTGNCNLVEGDNDQRTFKCDNGSYSMLNKTGKSRWVYYSDTYSDIVMEADGHAVSGPTFIEYGMIFRVSSDGKGFYGYTLTRDGKYTLWRCVSPCQESKDFVDLIPYTASNAVKSGTAVNHLKVVVQGNQIAIYVNDQWLNTVTDSSYSSGTFGLFLNNQEPNAQVAFENLTVSQITGRLPVPHAVPTATPTPH